MIGGDVEVVATLGRGEGGEAAHSKAAKTAAEKSPGTPPTAETGGLRQTGRKRKKFRSRHR